MKRWFPVLGAVALALTASPAFAAAGGPLGSDANAAYLAANAHKPGVHTMPDGLQYNVLQNGFGKHPGPADTVTVYYTLTLINGDKLDGTEPEFPAQFHVDSLISGWHEALQLMREGDHWRLVIPAALAYGSSGSSDGGVPPNQTLIFDLELLKTEAPPPKQDDPSQPDTPPAAGNR